MVLMSVQEADPFPPKFFLGFLSQDWVLGALGSPVNFSDYYTPVGEMFSQTGDFARGKSLDHLAKVLDHGVKVALVYGDRDYICKFLRQNLTSDLGVVFYVCC